MADRQATRTRKEYNAQNNTLRYEDNVIKKLGKYREEYRRSNDPMGAFATGIVQRDAAREANVNTRARLEETTRRSNDVDRDGKTIKYR